jgi:hypothetical protein
MFYVYLEPGPPTQTTSSYALPAISGAPATLAARVAPYGPHAKLRALHLSWHCYGPTRWARWNGFCAHVASCG